MNFIKSVPKSAWAAFCIGFCSLLYQVLSIEILFYFFAESSLAIALVLSSYLAGMAVSALFFSYYLEKKTTEESWNILAFLLLLGSVFNELFLRNYEIIPITLKYFTNNYQNSVFLKSALIWFYLFIPSFFIAGSFPVLNGLWENNQQTKFKKTGLLYSIDNLGAIVGILIGSLGFIYFLGIRSTALITSILLALASLSFGVNIKLRGLALGFIVLCLANVLQFTHKAGNTSSTSAMENGKFSSLDLIFGEVIFQKNSFFGKLTVGNIKTLAGKENLALFINHRIMCVTHSDNNLSETGIGRDTLAEVKSQEARILNIGLGCGVTAGEIATNKKVAHLDVIEINPVVAEIAHTILPKYNHNVLKRSNVKLHISDGFEYLRENQNQKYDAIIIDVEEPNIIYSSPLYTETSFRLVQSQLKQDGVFTLWTFFAGPKFSKILFNTLQKVFNHVVIRSYLGSDLVMYASNRPLSIYPKKKTELLMATLVADESTEDINELGSKKLEKHFNAQSIFSLPHDYNEKFFIQN